MKTNSAAAEAAKEKGRGAAPAAPAAKLAGVSFTELMFCKEETGGGWASTLIEE